MSRLAVVSCGGILALTVVGCNGQSQVSSVATPSTPVAKQPLPFVKPPVISKPLDTKVAVAPGLIQSTNPNERTKEVIKGRPDPFALLPGEATQNTSSRTLAPVPFISGVSLPRFQSPSRPPKISSGGHPSSAPTPILPPPPTGNAGSQFNPGHGNLLPPAPTPIATAPQLPPPPTTDLAQGVTVTGVVQVGDEMEAIVKAPHEATSRTVRAGQRLSDGQVLVKRIEINQDSPPVVILEQNGTEVARTVGEGVTGAASAASAGKPTSDNSNAPSPAPSPEENFVGDQ